MTPYSFVVISSAAQYALRALTYLALQPSNEYLPARKLAEELDIPSTFLAKVMTRCVDAGVVKGFRGPTGGLKMAIEPSGVSIRKVIEIVDGPDLFTSCVLGLPGCGEEAPCPLHDEWGSIRTAMAAKFEARSIGDLASEYANAEMRLRPVPKKG